jgi:hypothetical protein
MHSFTVSLPQSIQKIEFGPEDLPSHLYISELPDFKKKHRALGYGRDTVQPELLSVSSVSLESSGLTELMS